MEQKVLSEMEVDAIGEVLNISLGSAATAISTMLDARVDITTPIVTVQSREGFEFEDLEPAIGVEIENVSGLPGSNVMILKRHDIRMIIGMLMGYEMSDEEFQLDEITTSAVGEVMNQMMGASATALSDLLDRVVDISTPVVFPISDNEVFKQKYFGDRDTMIEVSFDLKISDKVESEFIYLIPVELAKEIVGGFFQDGMPDFGEPAPAPAPVLEVPVPAAAPVAAPIQLSSQEPVAAPAPVATPTPVAAPAPVAVPAPVYVEPAAYAAPQPMMQAAAMPNQLTDALAQMAELMKQQLELTQMQMSRPRDASAKKIKVDSAPRPNFGQGGAAAMPDSNLDLVMGVPVEVSVEIGRTKKLVKDVLELNKGSLVVLDRLAGEQVDLLVNGQCIAQGDVVVVDDSFGIRITEILDNDLSLF